MMRRDLCGIIIYISPDISGVEGYKFAKKGEPKIIGMNETHKNKLIEYADGKTMCITGYGYHYRDSETVLNDEDLTQIISKEGFEYYEPRWGSDMDEDYEEDEDHDNQISTLSDLLSVDYYKQLKDGNELNKVDIFLDERCINVNISENRFCYFKVVASVKVYKDKKTKKYSRVLNIKNDHVELTDKELISTEKGYKIGKNNQGNAQKIKNCKNKNKSELVASYEITYIYQRPDIVDNYGETCIYISNSGIYISRVDIP